MKYLTAGGILLSLSLLCSAVEAGQVLVDPLVQYIHDQDPVAAFMVFNQTGQSATVKTTINEYFVGNGEGVYGQDMPLAGESEANIDSDIVDLSPKLMILAPSASQVVRVKAVRLLHIPDGVYAFGVAFQTRQQKPEAVSAVANKPQMSVDVSLTLNTVAALYFSKGTLQTQGSIDACYVNAVAGKVYLLVSNTGSNYYKPKIAIEDAKGREITQTYFGLVMPKSRGVRYILLDKPDIASIKILGDVSHAPIHCQAYTTGVTHIPNWGEYHLSPQQP